MGVYAYVYVACVCTHTREKPSLEFIYMLLEKHRAVRSCDRVYALLLFLVEVCVCVPV